MSPDVEALRTRVALHVDDHPVVLSLDGDGAFAAVDALLPSDLFLRDGQCRQSMFLDPSGEPVADVLVARDDERYLLTVEGMGVDEALAYARRHTEGAEVRALDLASVSIHGPWAWELLGEVFEPGLAAIPYLNLFRAEGALCLRASRTGEFGYELLLDRARVPGFVERFNRAGQRFGLGAVSREALLECAFENWFFDPRFTRGCGCTAVELQLQWRVSSVKRYPGSEAITARQREGMRQRVACLVTDSLVERGDPVSLDGAAVGRVTHAMRSPTRGDFIAQALLDLRVSYGGVGGLRVNRDVPARTITPPFVNNQSLHVDPRRHSYECADEVSFPSAARGALGVAP